MCLRYLQAAFACLFELHFLSQTFSLKRNPNFSPKSITLKAKLMLHLSSSSYSSTFSSN